MISQTGSDITDLLLNLLEVEKFLEVRKLLYFFSLKSNTTLDLLVQLEIQRQVKILEFS